MKSKKRLIGLLIVAVLIKLFSLFPQQVEKYYSNGFYPFISKIMRTLFGWIPFSVGDILYALVALWLLQKIVATVRTILKRKADRNFFKTVAYDIVYSGLWIYIVFNVLWGLNYNRIPVAKKFDIPSAKYTNDELQQLMQVVVQKINSTYPAALAARNMLNQKPQLFKAASQAYAAAVQKENFTGYVSPSIKPSLFSYLGCWMGYTGYYNPFTAEAQVNTMAPVYTLPFTTCHEVGHQLGYAKENEANFAGFISAKSSNDKAFQYSVYFDLYLYGARDLYMRDSVMAKKMYQQLGDGPKADIKDLRQFYNKYRNPVEPYITKIYAQFLKANEQPTGMMSYNEVIAMVIAYGRKYGLKNI